MSLKPGDIILKVADNNVTQPRELQNAMERTPLETKTKLIIIRNGNELVLQGKLQEMPDSNRRTRFSQ